MSILRDQVIVVTGASGRLGRRMVQRFAQDGAAIAAVVRKEEDARGLPFPDEGEGWAFPVDVTDDDVVRACFDQILEQFGRVDALVHTVGMW
ncbi:MAG: SDR family oxidoreductase, partial [Rhodothermales bacterium]